MPEMDGQQLFREVRRRWPDFARRVIFAFGDTLHPDTRHFLDTSGCPCVDKPFKLEHLATAMTAIVGGTPPLPATPLRNAPYRRPLRIKEPMSGMVSPLRTFQSR